MYAGGGCCGRESECRVARREGGRELRGRVEGEGSSRLLYSLQTGDGSRRLSASGCVRRVVANTGVGSSIVRDWARDGSDE